MPSMPTGGITETDSYQTDIEEFPGTADAYKVYKGAKTFSANLMNIKTKSSKHGK
jgi:hypothetical protein